MSKSEETSQIKFIKNDEANPIVDPETRPNILVRSIRKIKSHPKITLAVTAGAGLIIAGYALGRPAKDDEILEEDDYVPFELDPSPEDEATANADG